MPILVDYQCRGCGDRAEHWTPSPPPDSVSCRSCGAEGRRLFAAVGLSGAPAPASEPPASSTQQGPVDVPAVPPDPRPLPHVRVRRPHVGRQGTRNSRAVDREQERQERAAAVKAPTMDDAITHHHASPTGVPAPTSGTD